MNPQITVNSEVFYIILTLIVLMLAVLAQKTRQKEFAIATAVVLIFVAGLRAYTVGRDTQNYVIIFEHADQGGYFSKELGFVFLCRVLLMIWNNYTFLFTVFAIIIYSFIIYRFWELRDKASFALMVFTFYSFCFFESMNATRQFCAVAIVFFATRYLQKRRYVPFMVAVAAATLFFHKSAILGALYLGAELFSWKDLDKKQKKLLISLFVMGVLFSAILIPTLITFTESYQHYFRNAEANIGLRVPALLFILLVSMFLYRKKERLDRNSLMNNEEGHRYLVRSTRIYYVLSCILGAIGYFFDFMGRIGYYFVPFQFVYFGMLSKERNWQYRWILKAMIYAITLYVLYGYIFVNNGAWHHPYHFIWNSR